jgi:hypothetical protein
MPGASQAHRLRHRLEDNAVPESQYFLVGQDTRPGLLNAALLEPCCRVGIEQVGIDREAENLGNQGVDAIGGGMFAGADNILDKLDDIGAADVAEVAPRAFIIVW